MIQPECVTDQQVVGLDTSHLHDLLGIYPALDQCHLTKQGQDYCRCRSCCRAFVPWDLLVMGAQVEANLSRDNAVDEQAQHGEHR